MTACKDHVSVDLIVHNARIYTVNQNFDVAQAMAIKNGKIVAIGPENAILNKYTASKEVDAELRPIYPGFIDAHCHFVGYAMYLSYVNLVGTKSFQDVLDRTLAFAKNHKTDWIQGMGWNQDDWKNKSFPDKSKLDSLFPNRPVFLIRIDGHAALANQKALNLAHIKAQTKISGGEIVLKNGKPTGLLIDNAMDLVKKVIPKMTDAEKTKYLVKAQKNCFAVGLTTLDDCGLSKPDIDLIDSLQQKDILKMRFYIMLTPDSTNIPYYFEHGPVKKPRLHICSFKFYADGALGSRGARMIEPYSDDSENVGLFLKDSSYYQEMAEKIYKSDFQMNTHAIGDAANRLILNIYGSVLKKPNDRRWRIEHCQVVAADDFQLFRKYTIIPSIQPQFAMSDKDWAEKRLGKGRMKNAYAWKKLYEQNGIVALGTDFPIESISPIKTFYAAVFGGVKPLHATALLTRKETLKGMTYFAAMSNFEEKEKGSLEVGKDADFVILDRDIMEVDKQDLLGTKILGTYIAGVKVYPE